VTAPTVVATYIGQTSGSVQWASTAQPKTTPTFNGDLGDILVVLNADANEHTNDNYGYSASSGDTLTAGAETTGAPNADAVAQIATGVLAANRTGMTVSANRIGGDAVPNNIIVGQFRASGGIGATLATGRLNNAGGPSFSFTTTQDDAAIFFVMVDWSAIDSAYSYRSVNGSAPTEIAQFHDGVNYGVAALLVPNAGSAGAKTLGLSSPTTGTWVGAAVEILGTTTDAQPGVLLLDDRHALLLDDRNYLLL
jgi:hypothetical protein